MASHSHHTHPFADEGTEKPEKLGCTCPIQYRSLLYGTNYSAFDWQLVLEPQSRFGDELLEK